MFNQQISLLQVPESGAQAVMEVICPWSDTSATFMSFDEVTARFKTQFRSLVSQVRFLRAQFQCQLACSHTGGACSDRAIFRIPNLLGDERQDAIRRHVNCIRMELQSATLPTVNLLHGTQGMCSSCDSALMNATCRESPMDVQDDVAARLEASRDREGVLVAESSGSSVNPAAQSTDEEGEGLAALDAGAVEDTTPVKEKIEAVATAIQRQEENSSDVSGCTLLSHSHVTFSRNVPCSRTHQSSGTDTVYKVAFFRSI